MEQLPGSSMMCRDARMSRAQDAQERPTNCIAVGPQQGRRVFPLQTLPACDESFDGGVVKVAGFSLHAGEAARADLRQKLERSCRKSRPAISQKRLSLTPNGNVRYYVKGFTSVVGAWMRRSDSAKDAIARRQGARQLRTIGFHRPAGSAGAQAAGGPDAAFTARLRQIVSTARGWLQPSGAGEASLARQRIRRSRHRPNAACHRSGVCLTRGD